MIVPVSVWSGVIELPTGVPIGLRAAGAAYGERVPTADVGAPTSRTGDGAVLLTDGGGGAGTDCDPCAAVMVGTEAAMTAPTVPAIPSIASRRVISVVCDDFRRLRAGTCDPPKNPVYAVAHLAPRIRFTEAGPGLHGRVRHSPKRRAGTVYPVSVLFWAKS